MCVCVQVSLGGYDCHQCYQLLGVDVILDSELNPFVIEVICPWPRVPTLGGGGGGGWFLFSSTCGEAEYDIRSVTQCDTA